MTELIVNSSFGDALVLEYEDEQMVSFDLNGQEAIFTRDEVVELIGFLSQFVDGEVYTGTYRNMYQDAFFFPERAKVFTKIKLVNFIDGLESNTVFLTLGKIYDVRKVREDGKTLEILDDNSIPCEIYYGEYEVVEGGK